jgi:hypothetical protein
MKFKSSNTTNYTLNQDFKSEIIWIQHIVPCLILEIIWQNITNDHEDSNFFVNTIIGK